MLSDDNGCKLASQKGEKGLGKKVVWRNNIFITSQRCQRKFIYLSWMRSLSLCSAVSHRRRVSESLSRKETEKSGKDFKLKEMETNGWIILSNSWCSRVKTHGITKSLTKWTLTFLVLGFRAWKWFNWSSEIVSAILWNELSRCVYVCSCLSSPRHSVTVSLLVTTLLSFVYYESPLHVGWC